MALNSAMKLGFLKGNGDFFFFFFWFAHSFHRCYGKGSRGARAIMCCAWVDIMTAGASDRTHCPENERVVTTNISEQKGGADMCSTCEKTSAAPRQKRK